MSEEILGRINGVVRSKDIAGTQTYNLIFTSNRIIAELIGDTGMTRIVLGGTAKIIHNKSILKRAMEMNEQKTPDEILNESKKNFEIRFYDVDQIYFKEILRNFIFRIKFVQKIPKIGRDIYFEVRKDRRGEVEPILMKIFPNRITYKKKR